MSATFAVSHPVRSRGLVTSFVCLLLLVVPSLSAQVSGPQATTSVAEEDQAVLLFEVAEAQARAGAWLTAALGYEGAGNLRPSSDPLRAQSFSAAAEAYRAGGFVEEATQMSIAAGRAAEETGAIALAAESYRNAALLNVEQGKSWLSSAYGLRACSLAESGHLSEDEARTLTARFGCAR